MACVSCGSLRRLQQEVEELLKAHRQQDKLFNVAPTRDDWFSVGDSTSSQPYIEWDNGDEAKTTVRVYEKVVVGGRVHFPEGRPIVGMKISIAGCTRYSGMYYDQVTSDQDGTWSALVKPNGYYLFAIRDEDYSAPAQEGIFVVDDNIPRDLDFFLEPPRRVFGKVSGPIDDRTYIRLYQRAPDYYRLPPGPRLPEPPPGSRGPAVSMVIEDYRKVQPDGSYEFRVGPGDFTIQGPDGKQQQFEIAHKTEREFNYQLEGPLRISTRFQVVLASDSAKPLPNAHFIGRAFPQSGRGSFHGVANGEGILNAERDAVNARVLVESIDKQLAAFVELGPTEDSKKIVVRPTVNITGRLRDHDGIPMKNASLSYGIELAFPSGGFSMVTSNERRQTRKVILSSKICAWALTILFS